MTIDINTSLDRLIDFSRDVNPTEILATYPTARVLACKVRYVQAILEKGQELSAAGFAYTYFRDTSDSYFNRSGYCPPSGVLLDDVVSEDVLRESTNRLRALNSSNTSVKEALLAEIGLEEKYASQARQWMGELGERISNRLCDNFYGASQYSNRQQNYDESEMERLKRNGLSFLTTAQLQRFEDSYDACLRDVLSQREQRRMDRRAHIQTLAIVAGSAVAAGMLYSLM